MLRGGRKACFDREENPELRPCRQQHHHETAVLLLLLFNAQLFKILKRESICWCNIPLRH